MSKEKGPFSDTAVCGLCGERVKIAGLTRHLSSCRKAHPAKPGKKAITTYTLKVSGEYMPGYFLYLEVTDQMRLSELDDFLRGIWLECCGHMSQFILSGAYYVSCDPDEYDDMGFGDTKSMKARLGEVLENGVTLEYEYDMGSTTYLAIKVVGMRQGCEVPLKNPVVLARNDPPAWACADCGVPAVSVDSMMGYGISPQNVFCKKCTNKRRKGEESYFLAIANSPRTGVCAYE